jgi:hypothetical protein
MSSVHDTIRPVRYAWTALFVALWGACSQTTNFGDPVDGGLDAQIEEEAAVDTGLSWGEAGQAFCGFGRLCACSNGVDDNDDDDLADGFDSECTGPFDDDEGSFRVNAVNEGNPNCADCFYDSDHRRGNDGCWISTDCTFEGKFGNGGGCNTCDAQPECRAKCEQITPNGCDCFGCCEVRSGGATVQIRLEASCDMKKLSDTNACPRCRINPTCQNPCDACELCPGRTLADLPSDCMKAVACGERTRCESTDDCTYLEFCSQGCCVPILF